MLHLGIKTRLVRLARQIKGRLVDTGLHSENFWANRTEIEGEQFAKGYWDSRKLPLRTYVADAILGIPGVHDVLEVGCSAGPNVATIASRSKDLRIVGIDFDKDAVAFGNRLLKESHLENARLEHATADRLPFENASFDLVLTCAVLSCIGPQKILGTLQEMKRVSRRGFVLFEPHRTGPDFLGAKGKTEHYPNTTYWLRDYQRLITEELKLPHVRFTEIQIPPEHRVGHSQSGLIVLF